MLYARHALPWGRLEVLSDADLCEEVESASPLHPELYARFCALPGFGPLAAAGLGRCVSRSGLVASDPYFREYVPSLPPLARAACELAIHWWFSEGLQGENTAAYASICEQVARDGCLDAALSLLVEARMPETIFGVNYMEETNDYVRALCAVAATL